MPSRERLINRTRVQAKLRPIVRGATIAVIAIAAAGCVADDPIATEEAVLRLELDSCRQGIGNRATAVSVGRGRAVTVAHSFEEVDGFRVVAADGTKADGSVVYADPERDIAVITFDDGAMPVAVRAGLAFSSEADDTSVRVILHRQDGPFVQDADVLRRVNVTLDGVGRRSGIEFSGDIERGDSGAPVVDDEGQILGLVFATVRTAERAWAIAASEVAPTLKETGPPVELRCD